MPNPFADSLDALPYEPRHDLQLPDLQGGDGWRSAILGTGAAGFIYLCRDADPLRWWIQAYDHGRGRGSTNGPVVAAAVARIIDGYLDDFRAQVSLLGWKPASLRVEAGRIVEDGEP